MPPFSSSMPLQYPYTTPLVQRPFPPMQAPIHMAYPSYSSTASPSHYANQPPLGFGFEKPITTSLLHSSPLSIDHQGTPVTTSINSPNKDSRRDSVIVLTLAPLTCPESTVHIIVHDNGKSQTFPIHRALLCFYSPYFRCLLNKSPKTVSTKIKKKNYSREWRWEDASSVDEIMTCSTDSNEFVPINVVIKLPSSGVKEIVLDTEGLEDVGRIVFAAFVNWLYHGSAGFGLVHPLDKHTHFDAVCLIQLWVFAGRVGVPECQNACVEGIEWWRVTTNIIQTSMLGWVYEQTEDGSAVDLEKANNTIENQPDKNDDSDDGSVHSEDLRIGKQENEKHSPDSTINPSPLTAADCPLRKLLIDQCAWKLDGEWLLGSMEDRKNEEQFPRQALVDLVSRMRVILNENVYPPFGNELARQQAYWMKVEEKSVEDALDGELKGLGISE